MAFVRILAVNDRTQQEVCVATYRPTADERPPEQFSCGSVGCTFDAPELGLILMHRQQAHPHD